MYQSSGTVRVADLHVWGATHPGWMVQCRGPRFLNAFKDALQSKEAIGYQKNYSEKATNETRQPHGTFASFGFFGLCRRGARRRGAPAGRSASRPLAVPRAARAAPGMARPVGSRRWARVGLTARRSDNTHTRRPLLRSRRTATALFTMHRSHHRSCHRPSSASACHTAGGDQASGLSLGPLGRMLASSSHTLNAAVSSSATSSRRSAERASGCS